ncbi:MAG: HAD family hydrolase [Gemmataceae bacterium]|nr:Cof-type HAD-IIB family hydrolase [Gemmata sp.]MDW8196209.1 HAD family hydrolase [Gemmataceae bacterium]
MRFAALATDYDGTIAHDGIVDDETIAALERVKTAGYKLLLVTGRVLPELLEVCPRVDLFDRAVVENGAVLYTPATRDTRVLAEPPPPRFATRLHERGVTPIGTGYVIVATFVPHEKTVAATIAESGLPLEVIMNKDAVMVLPRGIDKAFGLNAALAELQLPAERVIGIGDAENDAPFLRRCGYSVAVANALPDLKQAVHHVTTSARGAGVVEFVEQLLRDPDSLVQLSFR